MAQAKTVKQAVLVELTLDAAEVVALAAIIRHVGGHPDKSLRGKVDTIQSVLYHSGAIEACEKATGIKTEDVAMDRRAGGLYFLDTNA